jgi:hypothetical protein
VKPNRKTQLTGVGLLPSWESANLSFFLGGVTSGLLRGGAALLGPESSMSSLSTSFKQAIYGCYGLLSGHIGINRTGGYGTVPELLLDEPEILGITV